MEFALEDAAYFVNNKLSNIEVRGNKATGFDYKLKWYDDQNFHELECANKRYSPKINRQVIDLAQKIDLG